jgi:hypothetical protein
MNLFPDSSSLSIGGNTALRFESLQISAGPMRERALGSAALILTASTELWVRADSGVGTVWERGSHSGGVGHDYRSFLVLRWVLFLLCIELAACTSGCTSETPFASDGRYARFGMDRDDGASGVGWGQLFTPSDFRSPHPATCFHISHLAAPYS